MTARKRPLPVTHEWFETTRIDHTTTLVREPHVDPLLRANTWHVRGRDRDLFVDSGLGVASLRTCLPALFEREPLLVLTHAHLDHMGSAHEFTECWAHRLEPVGHPPPGSLRSAELVEELGLDPAVIDGDLPPLLINARPGASYDPAAYRLQPARVTRALADGDIVDLGDRQFTVLHLPGHSPGSIGLLDEQHGVLFSGDVVYDAELLDDIVGADVARYRQTMTRVRELPVRVVHAGHEDSFDRARLHELVDAYLADVTDDVTADVTDDVTDDVTADALAEAPRVPQ